MSKPEPSHSDPSAVKDDSHIHPEVSRWPGRCSVWLIKGTVALLLLIATLLYTLLFTIPD